LLLILLALTMTTPKKDNSCVRFIDNNYFAWELQLKTHVKRKGLWDHFDGKMQPPKEEVAFATWEAKDTQIIS